MPGIRPLLDELHCLDSGSKGRRFEHLTKRWLENSPLFQKMSDPIVEVWLWDDWPGNWGPDKGIDLVARTKSGALLAVQSKAYHPDYSISKSDVDKFLSESSRAVFDRRLLVGTTDKVHKQAIEVMDGQEKPVERYLLHELEAEQISWPDSLDDLQQTIDQPRSQAREHQQEALREIISGLEENDRGQAIMSCGTGKTLTGLWTAERLRSDRVLVLVPSLALMAQTIREWTANGLDFSYLPVCSEIGVASSKSDQLVERIGDSGIPSATTDPATINAFLRGDSDKLRVVFSTYQSAAQVAAGQKGEGGLEAAPPFDLGIFDEAHNCAGAKRTMFSAPLDDKNIACHKRLLMTATPRFITGRKKSGDDESFQTISMDDQDIFGPELYRLDFAEAIERDLLCNYQVIVSLVSDETIREWTDEGRFLELSGGELDDQKTDARTLAAHITVAQALRDHDLGKVITFHSRVRAAQDFAGLFPRMVDWLEDHPGESAGDDDGQGKEIWARHVSGSMPGRQREGLLRDFRRLDDSQVGVLSNARCLSEGVDVPSIDGVAFIDPKSSQVDIIQAVGRAIRKSERKKVGTIILPVYVGSDQDADEVLESGAFRGIWQVLRALRAHDASLGYELEEIQTERGRRGTTGRLPGRVKIIGSETVGKDFAEHFKTQLVEATTESWSFWFGLLESYAEENGGQANPPRHYETTDGYKLGLWCKDQRGIYKRGHLSKERAERLEVLPGWEWDLFAAVWNNGYSALLSYAQSEGHANPPATYRTAEGYGLGSWCSDQRKRYKKGDFSRERIDRLEELPGWEWDPFSAAWKNGYASLTAYAQSEGHANPPDDYTTAGGSNLGAWCGNQRKKYKQDCLPKERIEFLEALPGWEWDLIAAAWDKGYSTLLSYAQSEGHANPLTTYKTAEGYSLGRWCVSQRARFKKGKLSRARVEQLEALPGWEWDSFAAAWDKGYADLLSYAQSEGTASPSKSYKTVEGYNLGGWCQTQRGLYKKGDLSNERVKLLEALPGWEWDPIASAWNTCYSALSSYAQSEGTANPSKSYKTVEGYNLGRWCQRQRTLYKKGDLSNERVKLLEALPGWEWSKQRAR